VGLLFFFVDDDPQADELDVDELDDALDEPPDDDALADAVDVDPQEDEALDADDEPPVHETVGVVPLPSVQLRVAS